MSINIYRDDDAVVLWPAVTVGRDLPGQWFVEIAFWRWTLVWWRWEEPDDDDIEHLSQRATVIEMQERRR